MTRKGREHWTELVFGNAVYPQIAQISQMGQGGEVNHKAWMGLAVLAIGAVLVLGRYQVTLHPNASVCVRLDRWTGAVHVGKLGATSPVWLEIRDVGF